MSDAERIAETMRRFNSSMPTAAEAAESLSKVLGAVRQPLIPQRLPWWSRLAYAAQNTLDDLRHDPIPYVLALLWCLSLAVTLAAFASLLS